jgi:hypothetical protein
MGAAARRHREQRREAKYTVLREGAGVGMSSSAEESHLRLFSAIEREREARAVDEAPERGAGLHALAWGRIAQALEGGREPSVDDLLSRIAGDPSIPVIVRNYAADLVRRETKPTAGPKPV